MKIRRALFLLFFAIGGINGTAFGQGGFQKEITPYISNGRAAAKMYDFQKRVPGGTLTAGVPATVTLSASMGGCPFGVAGTNVDYYVYLSGGTGTPEAPLITGGTCTSGATSGTLQFTPANNHSGAWNITSATLGIAEAERDSKVVDATGQVGQMHAPLALWRAGFKLILGTGSYDICGFTVTGAGVTIQGQGAQSGPSAAGNTILNIAACDSSAAAITVQDAASPGTTHFNSDLVLRDLRITTSITGSAVTGLFFNNAEGGILENINVDLTNNTAAGTYGLHGKYMQDTTFNKAIFAGGSNGGSDAVYLESLGGAERSNGNIFISSRFQSTGGWGLHNYFGENNQFYGSHFQGNGLGGYYDQDDGTFCPRKTVIIGGWFEFNSGDSFKASCTEALTIADSYFPDGSTTNALNITFCQDCSIRDNFSLNTKPITVAGGAGNRITNNNGFGTITAPADSLVQTGSSLTGPWSIRQELNLTGADSSTADAVSAINFKTDGGLSDPYPMWSFSQRGNSHSTEPGWFYFYYTPDGATFKNIIIAKPDGSAEFASGGVSVTSYLEADSSSNPFVRLKDTSQGADQKIWDVTNVSGDQSLSIQSVKDDGSTVVALAIKAMRDGKVGVGVTPAYTLDVGGSGIAVGGTRVIDNAQNGSFNGVSASSVSASGYVDTPAYKCSGTVGITDTILPSFQHIYVCGGVITGWD